jgi:hypothetical protein
VQKEKILSQSIENIDNLKKFLIELCLDTLENADIQSDFNHFNVTSSLKKLIILQEDKWAELIHNIEEGSLESNDNEFNNQIQAFAQLVVDDVRRIPQERWETKLLKLGFIRKIDNISSKNGIIINELKEGLVNVQENQSQEVEDYIEALEKHNEYLKSLAELPYHLEKFSVTLSQSCGVNYQRRKGTELLTSVLDSLSNANEINNRVLKKAIKTAVRALMPEIPLADSEVLEQIEAELLPVINNLIEKGNALNDAKSIIFPEDYSTEQIQAKQKLLSAMGIEFESMNTIATETILAPLNECLKMMGSENESKDYLISAENNDKAGSIFDLFNGVDEFMGVVNEVDGTLPSWLEQANQIYSGAKGIMPSTDALNFMNYYVDNYFSPLYERISGQVTDELTDFLNSFDGDKLAKDFHSDEALAYLTFIKLVTKLDATEPMRAIFFQHYAKYLKEINSSINLNYQKLNIIEKKLSGIGKYQLKDLIKNSQNTLSDSVDEELIEVMSLKSSDRYQALLIFHRLKSMQAGFNESVLGGNSNRTSELITEMNNALSSLNDMNDLVDVLKQKILSNILEQGNISQSDKEKLEKTKENLDKIIQQLEKNEVIPSVLLESLGDYAKSSNFIELIDAIKVAVKDRDFSGHLESEFIDAADSMVKSILVQNLAELIENILDKPQYEVFDESEKTTLVEVYSKIKSGSRISIQDYSSIEKILKHCTNSTVIDLYSEIEIKLNQAKQLETNIVKLNKGDDYDYAFERCDTPYQERVKSLENHIGKADLMLEYIEKNLAKQIIQMESLSKLGENQKESKLYANSQAKLLYLREIDRKVKYMRARIKNDPSEVATELTLFMNGDVSIDYANQQLNHLQEKSYLSIINDLNDFAFYVMPQEQDDGGELDPNDSYLNNFIRYMVKGSSMESIFSAKENYEKQLSANYIPELNAMFKDPLSVAVMPSGEDAMDTCLEIVFEKLNNGEILKDAAEFSSHFKNNVLANAIYNVVNTSEWLNGPARMLYNKFIKHEQGSEMEEESNIPRAIKDRIYSLLGMEVKRYLEENALAYIDFLNTDKTGAEPSNECRDAFAQYYLQFNAIKANYPNQNDEEIINLLFDNKVKSDDVKKCFNKYQEKINLKPTDIQATMTELDITRQQLSFLIQNINMNDSDNDNMVLLALFNRLLMMAVEQAEQLSVDEKEKLENEVLNKAREMIDRLESKTSNLKSISNNENQAQNQSRELSEQAMIDAVSPAKEKVRSIYQRKVIQQIDKVDGLINSELSSRQAYLIEHAEGLEKISKLENEINNLESKITVEKNNLELLESEFSSLKKGIKTADKKKIKLMKKNLELYEQNLSEKKKMLKIAKADIKLGRQYTTQKVEEATTEKKVVGGGKRGFQIFMTGLFWFGVIGAIASGPIGLGLAAIGLTATVGGIVSFAAFTGISVAFNYFKLKKTNKKIKGFFKRIGTAIKETAIGKVKTKASHASGGDLKRDAKNALKKWPGYEEIQQEYKILDKLKQSIEKFNKLIKKQIENPSQELGLELKQLYSELKKEYESAKSVLELKRSDARTADKDSKKRSEDFKKITDAFSELDDIYQNISLVAKEKSVDTPHPMSMSFLSNKTVVVDIDQYLDRRKNDLQIQQQPNQDDVEISNLSESIKSVSAKKLQVENELVLQAKEKIAEFKECKKILNDLNKLFELGFYNQKEIQLAEMLEQKATQAYQEARRINKTKLKNINPVEFKKLRKIIKPTIKEFEKEIFPNIKKAKKKVKTLQSMQKKLSAYLKKCHKPSVRKNMQELTNNDVSIDIIIKATEKMIRFIESNDTHLELLPDEIKALSQGELGKLVDNYLPQTEQNKIDQSAIRKHEKQIEKLDKRLQSFADYKLRLTSARNDADIQDVVASRKKTFG